MFLKLKFKNDLHSSPINRMNRNPNYNKNNFRKDNRFPQQQYYSRNFKEENNRSYN